jgi:hypothetical protein
MYKLIENNTARRAFPAKVSTEAVMRLANRAFRESVGFDEGGDVALVLDADGRTLALYRYSERVFSTEAYLNG